MNPATHSPLISVFRHGMTALCLLCAASAAAQDYPQRPVRMILGIAPGGGVDTVGRLIAQHLTERLGQPFVVDNRPGAGGTIAIDLVRRASPDGHTLLFNSSTFLTNQLLYKVNYDTLRDLAPVTLATQNAYVLAINSGVPAKSIKELVALARAKPGQLNYASSGQGSLIHLTSELFKHAAGIDMVHVPYKGIALGLADVLNGQVQVVISSALSLLPHIKTGRIRALGVTSRQPQASLPGVPTIESTGYPGFEVTQWYGLMAPAGTPEAIRQRLAQEVSAGLRQPDMTKRLAGDGAEVVANTPREFQQRLVEEFGRWSKTIKAAGLRQE